MEKIFTEQGIQTEIFNIGTKDIRGCIACEQCRKLRACVFDDAVNEFAKKLEEADGMVVGSPVYYSAQMLPCRLFYSDFSTVTIQTKQ